MPCIIDSTAASFSLRNERGAEIESSSDTGIDGGAGLFAFAEGLLGGAGFVFGLLLFSLDLLSLGSL